jgi:hypothetical protein
VKIKKKTLLKLLKKVSRELDKGKAFIRGGVHKNTKRDHHDRSSNNVKEYD